MARTAAEARAAAPLMEVFASIQGEGAYVGEPQVFLRLRGCPVRCRWCDTPASWRVPARDADRSDRSGPLDRSDRSGPLRARVATSDGGTKQVDAWATPFQAACWIAEAEPGAPRTVSVTGGEPLLWPEFLPGLKPMLGSRRVHLETAGAHPRTLARVIDAFDHVSLDLKPDLDLDPPEELALSALDLGIAAPTEELAPRTRAEWRAAREACLRIVAGRDACAKIVVSGERTAEELLPLLDEVERCAPALPVYLQPATPSGNSSAPAPGTLTTLCEMARDLGLVVRVIPQVHRLLRVP